MDYKSLKWGALKTYAKEQGINTRGMVKVEIIRLLDNYEALKPFKGIKETHPFFIEVQEVLPHIKAFKKVKSYSREPNVNKRIAELFMTYIETDKNAVINTKCGSCLESLYHRMVINYNIMAEKYGEEPI